MRLPEILFFQYSSPVARSTSWLQSQPGTVPAPLSSCVCVCVCVCGVYVCVCVEGKGGVNLMCNIHILLCRYQPNNDTFYEHSHSLTLSHTLALARALSLFSLTSVHLKGNLAGPFHAILLV